MAEGLPDRSSHDKSPPCATDLVSAAIGLAPRIDAVRETIERERALPHDLIDALGSAGLFSLWLPNALGGAELNAVEFVEVIEAVSRLDGSVGWCACIAAAYSVIAGYLQPEVARAIYGDGRTVVAGATAPSGQAFVADGGYRVTGHWTYGSGIQHSTWVLGSCIVYDRDGARSGPDGASELRMVLFPTAAAEVIDTWRVSGLRGTGSHDYRVADLFVAEDFTIGFPAPIPLETGLLYATPLISKLAVAIAGVPLGIARAAIDGVVALAASKTPRASPVVLRDNATVQTDVARAEVLLGSARAYLFATIRALWDEVAAGVEASARQRMMVRLACAHAGQASAQAVDLMYNAAGGTAIFEEGGLERCFRDVHACTQHIGLATSNYEIGGRLLLGLDMGTRRF
jgi:alkylation response protein AidB-like acyl-CoA dehydrogenase